MSDSPENTAGEQPQPRRGCALHSMTLLISILKRQSLSRRAQIAQSLVIFSESRPTLPTMDALRTRPRDAYSRCCVTGMQFRSKEPNEPFGAMMTFSDGRRSALPADFRGSPVEVLAHMAGQVKHPVLRARLDDISWLLERKRAVLAGVVTEAYVEIVKNVYAGTLKFRFDTDHGALKYDARDLLRALC